MKKEGTILTKNFNPQAEKKEENSDAMRPAVDQYMFTVFHSYSTQTIWISPVEQDIDRGTDGQTVLAW